MTALLITAALVGLSTTASIKSQGLGVRFAFPPDAFALTSMILGITYAVSFGLLFGMVSSYSQLMYSSQLYFEGRMLGVRGQTAKKLVLSFGPAIGSLITSFLIVAILRS